MTAHARILDVSGLPPPQPMTEILAALRSLGADEYLVVQHRREPFPLYPMLQELGFAWQVHHGATPPIEILIWPASWPNAPRGAETDRHR
ncbi:MAG: DUF2249 domain-containing protein [Planctomycetota bacterium]